MEFNSQVYPIKRISLFPTKEMTDRKSINRIKIRYFPPLKFMKIIFFKSLPLIYLEIRVRIRCAVNIHNEDIGIHEIILKPPIWNPTCREG